MSITKPGLSKPRVHLWGSRLCLTCATYSLFSTGTTQRLALSSPSQALSLFCSLLEMPGVISAAPHDLAAGAAHTRWGPDSSAKDDASEAGEAQSRLRADALSVWQPLRWMNAGFASPHSLTCLDCVGWLSLGFIAREDVRIKTLHIHLQEHSNGAGLWEDKTQTELLRCCSATIWVLIHWPAYSSLTLQRSWTNFSLFPAVGEGHQRSNPLFPAPYRRREHPTYLLLPQTGLEGTIWWHTPPHLGMRHTHFLTFNQGCHPQFTASFKYDISQATVTAQDFFLRSAQNVCIP